MKNCLLILGMMLISSIGLQAQTKPVRIVDRIVAQVNEDIITQSDLNRAMMGIKQELAQKFAGDQLQAEIQKQENSVLEDLIRKKLILQRANEMGIGSSMDVQVSAYIEQLRKNNNIKDMDEFEKALEEQGMTLAGFRDDIKKDMIVQDVIGYFVDSRVTILTEEIERFYKDHAKEYSTPEEVTLSEVVVLNTQDGQAETLANEYYKRIKQGEAFTTIVSQYSKGVTASKGGGIGTYQVAKLNKQIADAIVNIKVGDVSPVIKMTEGYAILHVDERKPSALRPFDDQLKGEIKNILVMQRRTPELERFIAQLKEDAYIQKFPEMGVGK
jgi:peptidyl-prolyl cis-trans isomerase SurA